MQLSIRRTELAQTAVISLVTIAALALLALVGAYWTWQWFAPRPEAHLSAQPEPGGQVSAALQLFGQAQKDGNAPAPTGMAIRLLGVVAATQGREAYAVVVLDGKQIVATREGQEIASGIQLAEVAADHVVLERDGVRQTLAWPEKPQAAHGASN